MSNIHQTAADVRTQRLQAKIGEPADAALGAIRQFTGINKSPQAKNVWTVTVDTVTNNATYTITVNGQSISYTADGSATNAEITAGLKAAIEANPLAYAACIPTTNGAAILTLTARFPGSAGAFTVSDSDAKLTTAEATSEADAASVAFGDALIYTDAAGEDIAVARADGALLTAQVDTYVFSNSYVGGEVITASVEVPGYNIASAAVIAATDLDTSLTNLASALNAAIDAIIGASGAVTAAYVGASNTLTLTAQQAGKGFKSWVSCTSQTWTKTSTADSDLKVDVKNVLAGLARFTSTVRTSRSATVGAPITEYAPNEGVIVVSEGRLWVASSSAPNSLSSGVWLGLSGSERGKFYTSAAASRVYIPPTMARWFRPERSGGSDGIAALSFNFLV